MDPVYGYQAVNVESQLRNPLVPPLGGSADPGAAPPCSGSSTRCSTWGTLGALAYLRRRDREDSADDIVLCVNNLSKVAQPVEIDLAPLAGKTPVELFGQVPSSRRSASAGLRHAPPYGFYCVLGRRARRRPAVAVPR
ncbi:MAG: alpha-glucosidase C-terminal domain-containing protein [Acidimicrobiales bacterium]